MTKKKEVEKTDPERLLLAQAVTGQCLMELINKTSYSKKIDFSLDSLIKRSISIGKDAEVTKKEINEMLNMTMRDFYEMTLMKLAQSKVDRDQMKAEDKLRKSAELIDDEELSKAFLKTTADCCYCTVPERTIKKYCFQTKTDICPYEHVSKLVCYRCKIPNNFRK